MSPAPNLKTMVDTAYGLQERRSKLRSGAQNEYLIVAKLEFKENQDRQMRMQELSTGLREEIYRNIDSLESNPEGQTKINGKRMIESFIERQSEYIEKIEYLTIIDLSEETTDEADDDVERSIREIQDTYRIDSIKPSKPQSILISAARTCYRSGSWG